ncbi:MAG: FAD:protein FMN transferase [Gammaproteobacteria bacterium]|nr:FAD:protein FMN transferase [Gammaproteobacteria bacterium]
MPDHLSHTLSEPLARGDFWVGQFVAMASPCEVIVETHDASVCAAITKLVADEAWRVEQKFSRYRDDNIIYAINHSAGNAIEVDDEVARLLDFAAHCYVLSDGLFDVTCGVLRKIWRFDGSDNIPARQAAKALLPYIGWSKVQWQKPFITLPAGMEIDLGGIGKEYAVDSALQCVITKYQLPVLINFGGDLCASAAPKQRPYWEVGIESVGGTGVSMLIKLQQGALTTSGDARRYLLRKGKRYSHILNPRTAWPVNNAPRSVSVAAATCTQAGILSTLAMLHGKHAETFLKTQNVKYWIQA